MNKILIVGCGHMGAALLASWYKKTTFVFSVIEPNNFIDIKKKYSKKVAVFKSSKEIKNLKKFDTIIFAIKPNIAQDVVEKFNVDLKRNVLIISIIAGKKISFLKQSLGSNHQIVRVMPNMPALVEKGMSCLVCNKFTSKKNIRLSTMLFKKVGEIIWLKKESDIDKITAVSGSGPAYYFLFIQFLELAAKELGLSSAIAKKLVYQTAFGSMKLLENDQRTAKQLQETIAVKGGTTEAAIKVLNHNNLFKKIIKKAIKEAFKHSIKLGKY